MKNMKDLYLNYFYLERNKNVKYPHLFLNRLSQFPIAMHFLHSVAVGVRQPSPKARLDCCVRTYGRNFH